VNVTTMDARERTPSTVGMILCIITLIFGTIRWVLGGFVL
jgi:hypothetical protein